MKVLIVESAEPLRRRMASLLEGEALLQAGSLDEAVRSLQGGEVRAVVLGWGLRDAPGMLALDRLVEAAPGLPVLLIHPQPTVDLAVAAVGRGARDVLPWPVDSGRLRSALAAMQAVEVHKPARKATAAPPDPAVDLGPLTSQSPKMLRVFDQIRAVARTDATVLIRGETGTGKELVSRAIHQRSRRRDRPFVAVNCGAFTETLLESELFGHEKGSFTGAVGRREGLFEMADSGTLFLDELGETSLNVQVNLLRVLEELSFRRVGGRDPVKVDVRIVAATNVDLETAVRDGRFREDLFYRLAVFPLHLPPLRERREDIPLLLRAFLDQTSEAHGLEPPVLPAETLKLLLAYRWPGNVRQLRALCERWVITHGGQRLAPEDLPPDLQASAPSPTPASGPAPAERPEPPWGEIDLERPLEWHLDRVTRKVQRDYLCAQLARQRGHLGRTADAAGVTRRTLYAHLKALGVDGRAFRAAGEGEEDVPDQRGGSSTGGSQS